MFESLIIITDVGIMPDYRNEWPKLGVARITHESEFGLPNLGLVSMQRVPFVEFEQSEELVKHTTVVTAAWCTVEYFEDGAGSQFPPSTGKLGELDMLQFYGNGTDPVQLCCDEITKVEFENYRVFDILPEINFIPIGLSRLTKLLNRSNV